MNGRYLLDTNVAIRAPGWVDRVAGWLKKTVGAAAGD